MTDQVRAAVTVAPKTIEIRRFPYPKLQKGVCIVKMVMSGICGTDKHTYLGGAVQHGGTRNEHRVPYPIIQGHENVGIIVDIDEEAKNNLEFNGERLEIGDRVTWSPDVICGKCEDCRYHLAYSWCQNPIALYGNNTPCDVPPHLFGGFAEYMYLMPGMHVYKVPEGLSDECAMLAELMSCSYNVDKAKEFYSFSGEGFACNDTVVVYGVGPLGITHMIKSRILGAGKIIAIDTSEFRLKMAKDFSADYVIDPAGMSEKERTEAVMELTGGRGADLVIECVGKPFAFKEAMDMVRKGGMIIEPGNFTDSGEYPINVHKICGKCLRIIGQSCLVYNAFTPSMKMMLNYGKWIPFERLVTHYYGLEDTEEAIKKSMSPDSMKVVVCGNK